MILALLQAITPDAAKAALATLAAFLAQPTEPVKPVVKPSPLSIAPTLAIPDTVITTSDKAARIAVTLSEPAMRPLSWRCMTANGTAYAPTFYAPVDTRITFQPGQTVKFIDVPIKRDLGAMTVKLNCAWSLNTPPIAGASGTIRGGPVPSLLPLVAEPVYPAAQRTEGRSLAFSSTFMEPITPDAVKGAWRSRFSWGRVQTGNKEIAPYADASTDPGTSPHPIVDGKRVLRAEYVPTRDGGKDYAYSASLIDSANLFTFQRGYVELRVKSKRTQGTVIAFWLLPASEKWPPETDIFEIGLGDRTDFNSGTHFIDLDGKKKSEGTQLPPYLDDGEWHTVGFDLTDDWQVTFVDGVEVVRRPNIFSEPMKIILNVSVGGLGPDPKAPSPGWVSEMALDYIKVWE